MLVTFETSKRKIMNTGCCVIKVPYCHMQHLLRYQDEIAYTYGYSGVKSHIYYIKQHDTYISTGYQPFGNISIDYNRLKEIEDKACKIRFDYNIPENSKELHINYLLYNLVAEVREEWINKERD